MPLHRSADTIGPDVFQPASASRATAMVPLPNVVWTPNGRGRAEIMGSFHIEIAAVVEPVRSKFIIITSNAQVSARPARDSGQFKLGFTQFGQVTFYPGVETQERNSVHLPPRWLRVAMAPMTPNTLNTYSTTTGWSIGGKVGAEIAESPKALLELSASYSQSATETAEVPDFRVRNDSTAGVSDWVFEYVKVADNWSSMFHRPAPFREERIRDLAQLSKSVLPMSCQAVYQAPSDASGTQTFSFCVFQLVTSLSVGGDYWHGTRNQELDHAQAWASVEVPLDIVRHPA